MATVTEERSKTKAKAKFGQRALKAGYATKEQLTECLKLQKKYEKAGKKVPKIGELMVHRGYMSKDQVAAVLKKMKKAAQAAKNGAGDGDELEETAAEAGEEADAQEAEDAEEAGDAEDADEQAQAPKKAARKKPKREIPRLDIGTIHAKEFMVEDRMGEDPLGEIYLVRQDSKERPAYMIIVDPAMTADKSFKKQLVDRMKIMARLDHPNVQKLYTFGKSKGCYYVGLEYVKGEEAAEKLRARKPQDYTMVMSAWAQLIDALRALHASGLVHGYINPDHVTLAKDRATLTRCGTPWTPEYALADWGRLTPSYYAPEVLRGEEPTAASDVFSIGAIIYHLMTGSSAFTADSPEDAADRAEKGAPSARKYNGRIPGEVADLLGTLIAPDPADRPSDLAALKRQIAKLPQDIQTRVAMNYGAVLGAAAKPSTSQAKAPSRPGSGTTQRERPSSPGTQAPGKGPESGRKVRSTRTMNYADLVAQMQKDDEEQTKQERASGRVGKDGRTSLADMAKSGGKAYRRIDANEQKGLPKNVVIGLLVFAGVCALGGVGFYFWAKARQDKINEGIRLAEAERNKQPEKIDVKVTPAEERARQRAERRDQQWRDVQKMVDKLSEFDRKKLEQAIRLTDGVIRQGRKGWPFLGDAYQLLGRLQYYWTYSALNDDTIPTSVKKDHVGLAERALQSAIRAYNQEGAESDLELKLHAWMPERKEPTLFTYGGSKGIPPQRKLKMDKTKESLREIEVLQAGIKARPF